MARRGPLWALCALLLLICTGGWTGEAEAAPLPKPCLLGTDSKLDGATLIAQPRRFDCARDQRDYPGPVTWGLYPGLAFDTQGPDKPIFFRHSPHRFTDEAIWVRYADGYVASVAQGIAPQRERPADWMRSFMIPPHSAPVTDVLVRFTGVQHQRGIAPNAAISTRTEASAQDDHILAAFALCGGILLTLILYNLPLFAALRYRFVLAFSATAFAALGTLIVWSGAIFWLVPTLTGGPQISLLLLGFAAHSATIVWFLFDFIGPVKSHRWLRTALLAAVMTLLVSSTLRFLDPVFSWRAVDAVWYASLGLTMLGILAYAGNAAWRGNRPARIYFAISLLPILGAALRLGQGLGWADGSGVLTELSALFLMVAEAIMTALAVGWRIGQVKTERDEAHGRENALRALAEVDPLSGLLNRRAFLERACEGNHVKGLVLFDIDHFKSINDRFGHDVGDQVIAAFAALIGEKLPFGGVAGRMGGEEFAVLVPGGKPEAFARLICKATEHLAWTPDGSAMTVSAGAVTATIATEPEWRRAYIAADAALFDAKRAGRNRVVKARVALAA